MMVAILRVELFIPDSDSLKARRRVLKSIKDKVRSRFNVSICEDGEDSLWQRAALGIAHMTNDQRLAEKIFSEIVNKIEENGAVEIINREIEYI